MKEGKKEEEEDGEEGRPEVKKEEVEVKKEVEGEEGMKVEGENMLGS